MEEENKVTRNSDMAYNLKYKQGSNISLLDFNNSTGLFPNTYFNYDSMYPDVENAQTFQLHPDDIEWK